MKKLYISLILGLCSLLNGCTVAAGALTGAALGVMGCRIGDEARKLREEAPRPKFKPKTMKGIFGE